ncbi:MAG: o-succinylbenzoate synthase [Dehalococcoidia bacterium]
MRITNLEIFGYRLPLIRPVVIKGQSLPTRSGYLIRMTSNAGSTGWGDIAPLPGFSPERLEDARDQLFHLRSSIQEVEVPETWSPLVDDLPPLLHTSDCSSAVRFGIELALWNLCLDAVRSNAAQKARKSHRRLVLLNGLLTGTEDEIVNQAGQLTRSGYRAVKLKVGGRSLEEDIRLTLKVREVIGGSPGLRLDANRSWSLGDAIRFARAVEETHIEYIEEPLTDTDHLDTFYSKSSLPVALDETLLEHPFERLAQIQGIKAIVLKPTLLGGFYASSRLAHKARQFGLQPVVSSSFETGVGIAGLARFAAFASGDTPVGLDTYRWLASDVVLPRIETQNGTIDLDHLERKNLEINHLLLEELTDA